MRTIRDPTLSHSLDGLCWASGYPLWSAHFINYFICACTCTQTHQYSKNISFELNNTFSFKHILHGNARTRTRTYVGPFSQVRMQTDGLPHSPTLHKFCVVERNMCVYLTFKSIRIWHRNSVPSTAHIDVNSAHWMCSAILQWKCDSFSKLAYKPIKLTFWWCVNWLNIFMEYAIQLHPHTICVCVLCSSAFER